MSSIAYITDSKMLEHHRLHNHETMNFWRVTANTNFSDFTVNDLVFFLSKDKEQMSQKEKGIVGFGRVKKINVSSINKMWKDYKQDNGYNTIEEFKAAIKAVSKERRLPRKISSFYLENVTFFQPIYLSEFDLKISKNIESYIYIQQDEVVKKLLKLAKENNDIWTSENNETKIEHEEKLYSIFMAHKKIGNIEYDEKKESKIFKYLQKEKENTKYEFIKNCKTELYRLNEDELEILMYLEKENEIRNLIGQAKLFKNELSIIDSKINVTFKTTNKDIKVEYLMNN